MSLGGQAECSDQGCWRHRGALLAKSVCQGERRHIYKLLCMIPVNDIRWRGEAHEGFKPVGRSSVCCSQVFLGGGIAHSTFINCQICFHGQTIMSRRTHYFRLYWGEIQEKPGCKQYLCIYCTLFIMFSDGWNLMVRCFVSLRLDGANTISDSILWSEQSPVEIKCVILLFLTILRLLKWKWQKHWPNIVRVWRRSV